MGDLRKKSLRWERCRYFLELLNTVFFTIFVTLVTLEIEELCQRKMKHCHRK